MMLDIILKTIEILIILFIIYFIIQGRKNDEDLDKNPLSFFVLGLIFLLLALLTNINTHFSGESLILRHSLEKVYLFLTPLCFFVGSLFLRKESDDF